MALWRHEASMNWTIIGLGNGLQSGGTRPLPKPLLPSLLLIGPIETILKKCWSKCTNVLPGKCIWKCILPKKNVLNCLQYVNVIRVYFARKWCSCIIFEAQGHVDLIASTAARECYSLVQHGHHRAALSSKDGKGQLLKAVPDDTNFQKTVGPCESL